MANPTVDALVELTELKALPRSGWVRRGVPSPESVAAHSWGVAALTLLLLPAELDRERALAFAVLHDLPEVRVGDLTPADAVADKAARELAAMTAMAASLPRGDEILELYRAYERQDSPEARFVRQVDRLDMALQAVAYARDGHDLSEFLASAAQVIRHPDLVAVLREISR